MSAADLVLALEAAQRRGQMKESCTEWWRFRIYSSSTRSAVRARAGEPLLPGRGEALREGLDDPDLEPGVRQLDEAFAGDAVLTTPMLDSSRTMPLSCRLLAKAILLKDRAGIVPGRR
jgi:hypothetical protein